MRLLQAISTPTPEVGAENWTVHQGGVTSINDSASWYPSDIRSVPGTSMWGYIVE